MKEPRKFFFVVLAVLSVPVLYARQPIDELLQRAEAEMRQGDSAQAEDDFRQAYEMAKHGHDFWRAYSCMRSLGTLAEKQNDLPKAEECFKAGVTELGGGKKIVRSAEAMNELAAFYGRHQMLEKAVEVREDVVADWSKAVGADSLGNVRHKRALAAALMQDKRPAEAEEQLRSAVAILEANGPNYRMATEIAKGELIASLSRQGKSDEAQQIKSSLRLNAPSSQEEKLVPGQNSADLTPQVISKSEPKYSNTARKLKISGTVLLAIVIDEKGVPHDVQILIPLDEGLDQNAIDAVQSWRFKPGVKGGHPVAVRANIEVSFRLL